MVSAIAAGVVLLVAGHLAISEVQAYTNLSLPPLQQFYIQVLSDTTGSNSGYLDSTGQTHSQCHLATQWHVTDESLCSGNGSQLSSVPRDVQYVRFGGTDILNTSSLDHPLVLKPNGYIAWQNRLCTGGAATFGEDIRGILYAIFTGSGPVNLTSVLLQALDVKDCYDLPQASSSAPAESTTIAALTGTPVVAEASLTTTSATSASSTPVSLNCDNQISEYNGHAIVSVIYNFDEGSFSTDDADAYACCQSCQNTPGCAYSLFDDTGPGCTLTLAGGQGCSANGNYYTSPTASTSITIANGTCGEILYGGDISASASMPKANITPSNTATTTASTTPITHSVCNNGISTVNHQAITTVTADVEGTFPVSAATPYDCCISCQNEVGCQYAEFSTVSGCTLALASGQCTPVSFYTNATAPVSITLFNGTCGGVTYGGVVG